MPDDFYKSSFSSQTSNCVSVKICKDDEVSDGFKKSTFSGAAGHCTEVQMTDESVLVKDSKHPDVEPLRFTFAEWDAFVLGVKDGEFDLPV
jgi:hypothetical protein